MFHFDSYLFAILISCSGMCHLCNHTWSTNHVYLIRHKVSSPLPYFDDIMMINVSFFSAQLSVSIAPVPSHALECDSTNSWNALIYFRCKRSGKFLLPRPWSLVDFCLYLYSCKAKDTWQCACVRVCMCLDTWKCLDMWNNTIYYREEH